MRFQLPKFMTMTSNKQFTEFLKAFRYKDKNESRTTKTTTTTLIQHSVEYGCGRRNTPSYNDSVQPMDIDDDNISQSSSSSNNSSSHYEISSPPKDQRCSTTEKQQYIYIFKTNITGMYKVGRTNNLDVRKRTYNTGIIGFDFEYTNEIPDKKLETIIFNFLDKYRVEKKREFFKCDLCKIIHAIEESIKLYNAINDPPSYTTTSKSNKRRRTVSPTN